MNIAVTKPTAVVDILMESKIPATPEEARALIRGGTVRLNGETVRRGSVLIYPEDVPAVLRVGRYHRIDLEGGS